MSGSIQEKMDNEVKIIPREGNICSESLKVVVFIFRQGRRGLFKT